MMRKTITAISATVLLLSMQVASPAGEDSCFVDDAFFNTAFTNAAFTNSSCAAGGGSPGDQANKRAIRATMRGSRM